MSFITLLLLGGCKFTESTSKNAPRQINYSQYETYSYGNAIIVSSENPAFSWPQFSERVQREIDFVLPGKGLEKVTIRADLQIFFYAIIKAGQDRPLLSYNIGWAAEPFIENGELFDRYPANTLMIDFIDTNTNQLVWRASTQLPYDDQNRLYKVLPEQIHKIIQKYPLVP